MPKITVSEPDKTPQPYRLEADHTITNIGRGAHNDIVLHDSSASTNHCILKRVEGGYILEDNNSTNGIKYQNTQYAIIDLKDDMTVQIGDQIHMQFILSDEEKEILALEEHRPQQKSLFPEREKTPKISEPPSKDKQPISLKKTSQEDEPESTNRRTQEAETNTDKSDESSISTKIKLAPSFSILTFTILAILLFLFGLAIRHYQDYKTFIFSQ